MTSLERAMSWAKTYLDFWKGYSEGDDTNAARVLLTVPALLESAKHLAWIIDQPEPSPGSELEQSRRRALRQACDRVRDAVQAMHALDRTEAHKRFAATKPGPFIAYHPLERDR